MVLEVCAELAARAEEPAVAVRDGHVADSGQWLQGLAGLGWPAAVHDREERRPEPAAQESHVLQPYRPAAVQGLRDARAEADVGGGGDGRLRPGVECLCGFVVDSSLPHFSLFSSS